MPLWRRKRKEEAVALEQREAALQRNLTQAGGSPPPALPPSSAIIQQPSTWQTWNVSTTSNTSGTSNIITWTSWNNLSAITSTSATWTGYCRYSGTGWTEVNVRQETAAERQAREAQNKLWQETYAKQEAEKKRAKLRARKLLVDHLSPEQRQDYEKQGFFYLYTNKGRKYRIDQGTHGNVKLVDVTGLVIGAYCAQPAGVPDEDAMLAQKLMLEMDEEEFINVANFTRLSQRAVGLLDAKGRPLERVAA